MKKHILTLLTLLLCLTALGCGISEEDHRKIELYEKYEGLIEAIEDENHTKALKKLESFFGNRTPSPEKSDQESTESADSDDSQSPESSYDTPSASNHDPLLIGAWFDAETTLVFRADHTCTIRGEELTWEYHRSLMNEVRFQAMRDGKPLYYVDLLTKLPSPTHPPITLLGYVPEDNTYSTENGGYFWNAAEIVTVELTLENWRNYFEIHETTNFAKDVFDEIVTFGCSRYYILSPQYQSVNRLTTIAIEYEITTQMVECTVDPTAQAYRLGEILSEGPSYTDKGTMGIVYTNDGTSRLGFSFSGASLESEFFSQGGSIYLADDVDMLRIKGTLYLLK